MQNPLPLAGQAALITGAAHRIGAQIARTLHAEGMNLLLHYRRSGDAARALQAELEESRGDSVVLAQADLHETYKLPRLVDAAVAAWGRLDLLVNNASSFYPTAVDSFTEDDWDDLIGSNLKAPLFLSQAAAPHLARDGGSIINLVDIHAERPKKNFPIYSIAKAGNAMMVKALARELGPAVRVNGVAPGAILWPEHDEGEEARQKIISRTALKRAGSPADIARTVLFLARDADYITGQIIAVDGGRSTQH